MERETLSPIDGSLPKEFFIQKSNTLVLHTEDIAAGKKFKYLGDIYNRQILDSVLEQQVRAAGVQVVSNALFHRLVNGGLEIDHAGQRHLVSAQCIAAADGVKSRLRHALGLESEHFLAALQYRVKMKNEKSSVHFFGSLSREKGMGWFIPRGRMANVGFGVMKPNAHVLILKFHQLLDALMASDWIESDELSLKSGGLIPIPNAHMPPGTDGILLLGDAAGLRDVTFSGVGMGIATGCIAGHMTGKYIAEEIQGGRKKPRVDGYLHCLKPLLDSRLRMQGAIG